MDERGSTIKQPTNSTKKQFKMCNKKSAISVFAFYTWLPKLRGGDRTCGLLIYFILYTH